MAWITGESFGGYNVDHLTRRGWVVNGASSVATGGRRNGRYLEVSAGDIVLKRFSSNSSKMICGAAVRWDPLNLGGTLPIFTFRNGSSVQCCLAFSATTGVISAYRGASNGTLIYTPGVAITPDVFRYIEFGVYIHTSAGTVEIRIDGQLAGSVQTGVNTADAGVNGGNCFSLGANGGSTTILSDLHFQDLYVCDDQGSINNDFLGDVVALWFPASGPGNYQQFTPSTGTDHDALVDELTPDTADYVSSDTTGQKETFTISPSALTGIHAVQVCNYVVKPDTGNAKIRNLLRNGTTDQAGADFGVAADGLYSISVHETDPNTGAAWTPSGLATCEPGIENRT